MASPVFAHLSGCDQRDYAGHLEDLRREGVDPLGSLSEVGSKLRECNNRWTHSVWEK